jgi:acetyl-CoA synthetase
VSGPSPGAWASFLAGGGAALPFERQAAAYAELSAARPAAEGPLPCWLPGPAEREGSRAARFAAARGLDGWAALHAWSVADRAGFWEAVVADLGIPFDRKPDRVLDLSGGVPAARWFPGARLNAAAAALAGPADRTAILEGREGSRAIRRVPLGELRDLAAAAAGGFLGMGLREDDAVALYLPMTVECVVAYLGAVAAGLRVVSVADSFPAPELARRLALGGAKAVVTVDRFARGGKEHRLLDRVREAGGPAPVVIPAAGDPGLRPGERSWADFLAAGAAAPPVPRDPEDVTNVLFSSGTTATPKAIPWTHLTPLKCMMDARFHQDVRAGDVVAWPTNIGWMMGPWLVYASLGNGAAMALFAGNPGGAEFCRFVADAGVTMLGTVPSLVRAWRSAGAAEGADWSAVRAFSSTGEASHREDALWLMARAGYRAPVIEYCGGTEIGGGHLTGSLLRPAAPAAFSTPALGLDFRILDEEGRPVPEGTTGEIFLVPPSVGLSRTLLHGDHDAVYHDGVPSGPAGEVLRRHGDAVEALPGGFWRAHGRADDAMNLGGIKVSSLEIERVADGDPGVYQSAAVAVQPGGEGVDRLVLFVVPRGSPDPAALRAAVGARIAAELNPLFRIHDLVLVPEIPRTASNKVLRRSLRAEYGRGPRT